VTVLLEYLDIAVLHHIDLGSMLHRIHPVIIL